MKFVASAKAFSDAVSAVSRVVEHRNTYPILANVFIGADAAGKVSLRATDLDIEISLQFDAAVAEPGQTTVPSRTLSDILKKMDKAWEVTLETSADDKATLKAGRSRFSLQTLSTDNFPDLKVGVFSHTFDVAGSDLRKIIGKTSFAISTEETRYYLNGIYFHTVEDGDLVLRGVATDGHRMARCQVAAPNGAIGMPGIIIPKKTVAEVSKLIDKADVVGVEVSDTKIRFSVNGVVLLSKLIEGQFPDYDRVTPKNNNKHAVLAKGELGKALDRVTTIASDRGGKAVKLTLADGNLNLEVSNPDHGTATEELAARFDPEEKFEIGFNANYLSTILDVIDGADVRFELNDSGSPTILRSDAGDNSFLAVLMPMRA